MKTPKSQQTPSSTTNVLECEALFNIGDAVTVLPGASRWMRERGFWIDEWPESIDGMPFTIVADYTPWRRLSSLMAGK